LESEPKSFLCGASTAEGAETAERRNLSQRREGAKEEDVEKITGWTG
jgi:hypothetical protein